MRNVNPPTLAEVIHLQDHAPRSLETAAASINRHIDLFTRAARSCQAHRVRAGHELIAVRKRIPEGEWEAWCADNIHRSMGDIRKMMAMARTGHPEMAAEEERATNREAQQRSRANRADVSAVKRLARDFAALDENEKAEFMSLTGLEKCSHD
jgi:hypothetical protein